MAIFICPPIPESRNYDLDGNLILDSRWEYVWDGENRLTQMTAREAAVLPGSPKLRLNFEYDYQSRRISKKVKRYNASQSTWELTSDLRFVYDGWNVIAEIQLKGDAADAPNAGIYMGTGVVRLPYLVRSYVWGPDVSGTEGGAGGVGGLLAMTRTGTQGQKNTDFKMNKVYRTYLLVGFLLALAMTSDKKLNSSYEYIIKFIMIFGAYMCLIFIADFLWRKISTRKK